MKKENFFNKLLSLMAIWFFILTLIPICYLSFVNRASGDDYGYGTYTRAAWVTTHSLIEVGKAIWRTIRQYYYGWQGTWFSIALFSLQPEVFSEKAYVITTLLILFLWIGSTFLLFKEILVKRRKLDKWSYRLITVLFLLISIQFIPSTKSAIFWFNGCAHYMIPFTMCQLLMFWLLRFGLQYKLRNLVGIAVLMALLGGSNYQAALFAVIVAFYAGIADYWEKRNRRIFLLLIPIVLETIGLIISMKAPGNKVRGGEEFGLSFAKAVETVGLSFVEGIKTIGTYLQEKPLIFVGILILFLFMLKAMENRTEKMTMKFPVIRILALFCLYCAMQAPAIYANVEVSGGVHNMNYQVFLLMAGGIGLIISELAVNRITFTRENFNRKIVIPVVFICLILIVVCRGNIKESTCFKCMEYIVSGQASDYKEQMDLQTKLLMDEDTQDVVLPFINDVQGPLMHMPATEDKEAWTNTVIREFYGKDSVVAMPRPEWEEKYGDIVNE